MLVAKMVPYEWNITCVMTHPPVFYLVSLKVVHYLEHSEPFGTQHLSHCCLMATQKLKRKDMIWSAWMCLIRMLIGLCSY